MVRPQATHPACVLRRNVRLECLGLLRGLVAIAKVAPERTNILSRSVQPILWRISESLLEEHSALGRPGSRQTAAAPGSSLLTAELISLAEDLVLHAPASLHASLGECQSFVTGWQLPYRCLDPQQPAFICVRQSCVQLTELLRCSARL